jgi:hypothetical protein
MRSETPGESIIGRFIVVLKKNSFETGYLYKKNRRHLECPQLGVTPKFLLVRLESRIYTLELNWGALVPQYILAR